MSNPFKKEDRRKDSLFSAWINYLDDVHREFRSRGDEQFEDIVEGIAEIVELRSDMMRIKLEGRLRTIPITPEIKRYSAKSDALYLIAGKTEKEWIPLDVISVGSMIVGKQTGYHMTINPLHMEPKLALTKMH